MRYAGKVAIVTGAARGIGRAIAQRLAAEGATIVANDVLEVEWLEGNSIVVGGDIADPEVSARIVSSSVERFGRIDVVVNNAFWAQTNAFSDQSLENWTRTLNVSLTGPMLLSKAALPWLGEEPSGNIVNIASIHSIAAGRNYAAYEAAKTGLVGLTRALAAEFGRQGVRVNAVCPGLVLTERNEGWWPAERVEWVTTAYPLGRIGTADDIAAAVAFLASEEASFITGALLPVDGGLTSILAELPALELFDRHRERTN